MTPGTGSRVPGNRDNGRFSPGAFQSLFAGRRILWQCFFGAYCVGLDVLLPIELVRSLDDGSDFDLITDGCGIHFATVEHANGPERRRRVEVLRGTEEVADREPQLALLEGDIRCGVTSGRGEAPSSPLRSRRKAASAPGSVGNAERSPSSGNSVTTKTCRCL